MGICHIPNPQFNQIPNTKEILKINIIIIFYLNNIFNYNLFLKKNYKLKKKI